MVQNDNVPLLQMKTVEVVKGIFGVHDIVKYDESCSLGLLLITDSYLSDAAVPAKEVVEVVPCDLVVQILDKQYPVCAWRQFGLLQLSGKE